MQKKLFLGAMASVMVLSASAMAGGYNINEFSMTNMGRSFAGQGVVGDDYSAIAFNPAGMTLNGTGIQVGGAWIELKSRAPGQLDTGLDAPIGKIDLVETLPHFFGQYKINDNFVAGLGVYTPFGLATKYNNDWYGATHGTKTKLFVLDIAGAVAVKPVKQISVGMALIARYVYGDLLNQVGHPVFAPNGVPGANNEMDMDGWDMGYNVGIMYEPIEDLRFGVAYKFQSSHTVKGTQEIAGLSDPLAIANGIYDAESTMTLPNQLSISAFWKAHEKFGFSALARLTEWHVFDDFIMMSDYGKTTIPEKWKDSWTLSLGVDYYFSDSWTFRGGVAFDQSPVRNAKYRTARIPDSDRYWVSVGFSYYWENLTVDVGYAHLFMRKSKSNNTDVSTGTTIDASYDGRGNMLGVQLQYNF